MTTDIDRTHATTTEFSVPSAEEFKRLRIDKGVTQSKLASEIGSTQTSISQFELGYSDMMSATLRDAVDYLNGVDDGE